MIFYIYTMKLIVACFFIFLNLNANCQMKGIERDIPYNTCRKLIDDQSGKKNDTLSDRYNMLIYELNDSRVVVLPAYNIRSSGVIYKNISILNDVLQGAFESTKTTPQVQDYFSDINVLENKKKDLKQQLKNAFGDQIEYDYSINSLNKLDSYILKNELNSDILLGKHFFLPLLYYIGDILLHNRAGEWSVMRAQGKKFLSIKFLDGEEINLTLMLFKEISGNGYEETVSIESFAQSIISFYE